MTVTAEQREQILADFHRKWPLSALQDLTLEQYICLGDKSTLAYWLEFGEGRFLGSIKGGDASKFGIYERKNQAKGERGFISSDERYSWKNKYGHTAAEAFATIKADILTLVRAAQAGDTETIEALDFEVALKWKLAFLYQDHDQPCVLPIYKLQALQTLLPDNRNLTHPDAYRILLAKRGNNPLIQYGLDLWKESEAEKDDSPARSLDDITDDESEPHVEQPVVALNQILYGPPGTGKTWNTVNHALAILDPAFLDAHRDERHLLKARFDALTNEGHIDFVTFHQSFSYEDFVEGIRADITDSGAGLQYRIEDGIFKKVCLRAQTLPAQPHVLIIDEINRGNISRIFGELITLIEPSKRQGQSEALDAILPYSKKRFSVPGNLYIIGTMNTADRSLSGLDIALRRRFTFIEMLPQPELLDDVVIRHEEGDIQVGNLLRVINQRIEVLLDRDHCLGHAWFMPLHATPTLPTLASIFKNQVIPLLQEYFFEDWQRINWVLNGHHPDRITPRFISPPAGGPSLEKLFGKEVAAELSDRRWQCNEAAFLCLESYRLILREAE